MPVPTATAVAAPRRLLVDTVQDTIRDWIFDGALTPGEVLHDADLIAATGVSRTPIREALCRLKTAGLVEMIPNRHTRVVTPAPEDAAHAAAALRLTASGLTDTPTHLTHLLTLIDQVVDAPTIDGIHRLRTALTAAAETCSNRVVVDLLLPGIDGALYRLHPTHTTATTAATSSEHAGAGAAA